jgi:hypothetical protein
LGYVMDLRAVRRFLAGVARDHPGRAARLMRLGDCAKAAQGQALHRWRRRFSRDDRSGRCAAPASGAATVSRAEPRRA